MKKSRYVTSLKQTYKDEGATEGNASVSCRTGRSGGPAHPLRGESTAVESIGLASLQPLRSTNPTMCVVLTTIKKLETRFPWELGVDDSNDDMLNSTQLP